MFSKVNIKVQQEQELFNQIDPQKLPKHIAIIMDGNGRWAKKRGLPRVAGHRAGIQSVREIIETSAEIGLNYLTLYAFSAENWQRPPSEVSYLMGLVEEYVLKELETLKKNNIKFQVLGRIHGLAPSVRTKLEDARQKTSQNTGLNFNVALNYGARLELVDAFQEISKRLLDGAIQLSEINEELISQNLYTRDQPDPDLLIRTSGEFRISNFLLWQLAYAEIFVTPVLWPDFKKLHFFQAILDYQGRERRFGKVISP
ncbi:isoprenyl transferase [candidate division CSSED10-310 bacterium]|uniref:Isoprenyl transferase n=1 Tax=candidate division CSSED10-310 bacterium TaxID=2855610 RepID=A0ABV6YVQ8_UNCC1